MVRAMAETAAKLEKVRSFIERPLLIVDGPL